MNMDIPSSQKPKAKNSVLGWWRAISLPPDPPPEASFKLRDMVRRAQLASVLLFWFILVLIGVFIVFLITNPANPSVYGLMVLLLLMLTATFFNRKGMVNVAGFIMSTGITLVIWGIILSNHDGLAPENIGLFDLLVYPELFAASLLSVNWVFAWALANSTFVVLAFTYAPHTKLMGQLLAVSRASIIERPIQVQVLVSIVLWLWVRNATNAIKRADRAEEISKLQRVVADQMLEKVNQKRQLDTEIQQIEYILDQSAVGNLDARVVPVSGNMLWSISGKLNNLLSRFRGILRDYRQMQQSAAQLEKYYMIEQKYRHLVRDLNTLAHAIQQAQSKHRPIHVNQSGTPLDVLLQNINGKYISENSSSEKRLYSSFQKDVDEIAPESEFSPDRTRDNAYIRHPDRYPSI